MSVPVLLSLFYECGKKIKCETLLSILSGFPTSLIQETNARSSLSYDTKITFNLQFLHLSVKILP